MNNELDQIVALSKQTALNVAGITEQMGVILPQLKKHEVEIMEIKEENNRFKLEQENKWRIQSERERVEADEVQELDNCITNRIVDLFKAAGVTDDLFKKYFGLFKRKAWYDGKRYSHVLGRGGVDTKRMYFDEVKEYYGTWTPHGYGVAGYIEHLNV